MSYINSISLAFPTNKYAELENIRNINYKKNAFSNYIPGDSKNRKYIFETENEYNLEYANSLYAITLKKAGWDCFRHYEIIATGAIPFFLDIELIPSSIMTTYPKSLVLKAMNLPGMPTQEEVKKKLKNDIIPTINFNIFNINDYYKIRKKILEHFEQNCLTNNLYNMIFKYFKIPKKVQVISYNLNYPDHIRDLLIASLLENNILVTGNHKIDFLFKDSILDKNIYGKGFNYTKFLSKELFNNYNICNSIDTSADFIIFSTASNLPCLEIDKLIMPTDPIIIELDGNDGIGVTKKYAISKRRFIRELYLN